MEPHNARSKPDADEIADVVSELAGAEWLGPQRSWWPHCLVHVTDILNAVSIIKTGQLLSRRRAIEEGLLTTDSASRSHIAGTDSFVMNHARLYFRPRTQTFEINEGFLPRSAQKIPDAHCPIPVAFLFEAVSVLALEGTQFSDGNLARRRKYLVGRHGGG